VNPSCQASTHPFPESWRPVFVSRDIVCLSRSGLRRSWFESVSLDGLGFDAGSIVGDVSVHLRNTDASPLFIVGDPRDNAASSSVPWNSAIEHSATGDSRLLPDCRCRARPSFPRGKAAAQTIGLGVVVVNSVDKSSVSAIELFASAFSVNHWEMMNSVLWRCFCLAWRMQDEFHGMASPRPPVPAGPRSRRGGDIRPSPPTGKRGSSHGQLAWES
jgi:hypothetical protein